VEAERALNGVIATTFALAMAGASALAPAARAERFLFTLTGASTASFVLDSAPTPDGVASGSFEIANVPES
jgi:hypothetical protein